MWKLSLTVVLCLVFTVLSSALIHADDFPTFRGPMRNGIAEPGPGLADCWLAQGPKLLWRSRDLGVTGWDHDKGQVVVSDGLAYAYTRKLFNDEWHRLVTCFDPDGKVLWEYKAPARPAHGHQTPSPTLCVAHGRVFGSSYKRTFCLDTGTGEVIWETDQGRIGIPSPVVVGDVLVFRHGSGLEAVSTQDGKELWTFQGRGNASLQSPAVWQTPSGTYIVGVVDEEKQLVCVAPTDGRVLWDIEMNQGETRIQSDNRLHQATPTINNDWLVVTRTERRPLMAFRLFADTPERRPELVWTSEYHRNSPLIHQGYIYCGYTRRDRAVAHCLDLITGEWKWSFGEGDSVMERGFKNYGDPILADGKVYVTMNQKVFMFRPNPYDLGFLGKTPDIDSADTSSPAIADGRMYVLCYRRQGSATVACFDIAAPLDAKPMITQTHLDPAFVGQWYHRRLWVSSGNGMRTWQLTEGDLPPGLTLDPKGTITGWPQNAGTFPLSLAVMDEDGDRDNKAFSLPVNEREN